MHPFLSTFFFSKHIFSICELFFYLRIQPMAENIWEVEEECISTKYVQIFVLIKSSQIE